MVPIRASANLFLKWSHSALHPPVVHALTFSSVIIVLNTSTFTGPGIWKLASEQGISSTYLKRTEKGAR